MNRCLSSALLSGVFALSFAQPLLANDATSIKRNDTALAINAVLKDSALYDQIGNAYISSVKVGFNASYSHYNIDVNYQLIDSPVTGCIRYSAEYSYRPGEASKNAVLLGACQ